MPLAFRSTTHVLLSLELFKIRLSCSQAVQWIQKGKAHIHFLLDYFPIISAPWTDSPQDVIRSKSAKERAGMHACFVEKSSVRKQLKSSRNSRNCRYICLNLTWSGTNSHPYGRSRSACLVQAHPTEGYIFKMNKNTDHLIQSGLNIADLRRDGIPLLS